MELVVGFARRVDGCLLQAVLVTNRELTNCARVSLDSHTDLAAMTGIMSVHRK
jgi:hypothetical protein